MIWTLIGKAYYICRCYKLRFIYFIMLSRRHLRIKTLQAVYAFYQSGSDNLSTGEKFLIRGIDKLYELYINQLELIVDLVEFVRNRLEEGKKKFLPTDEDLSPNFRFADNQLILQLSNNEDFLKASDKYKTNWREEINLLIKLYTQIKEDEEFIEYMNSPVSSYRNDKELVSSVLLSHLDEFDLLRQIYEDRSVFWSEADYDISLVMVLKTVNSFKSQDEPEKNLPGIFKDEDEDRDYMVRLFRKTILKGDELEKMIEAKAQNWELERIAIMDMIILKMALAEILEFPSIPVKVSMNEYIELSKIFSTAKSKLFINGVLDKLIQELNEKNLIRKTGRGLLSS